MTEVPVRILGSRMQVTGDAPAKSMHLEVRQCTVTVCTGIQLGCNHDHCCPALTVTELEPEADSESEAHWPGQSASAP
eukprot:3586932-Rhodomonas_salina.3